MVWAAEQLCYPSSVHRKWHQVPAYEAPLLVGRWWSLAAKSPGGESTGTCTRSALGASGGRGGAGRVGPLVSDFGHAWPELRRLAGTSQRFRASLRVAAGPDLAESAPGPWRGGWRLGEVRGLGWGGGDGIPAPSSG